MVRKAAIPAAPVPIVGNGDDVGLVVGIDDTVLDDMPDVDRIRLQLGDLADGESRVNVYRDRAGAGQKDVFLCTLDPSEFDMQSLQSAYGAGIYRIRVYGSDVNGRPKLQVNQRFELGEPLRAARAVVNDDARSPDISRALAMIVEEVRQLRNVPAPVPVDPMANMKTMLEMMTLFKAVMPAAAPASAAMDPASMIKLMREMKGFGEELAGNAPRDEGGSDMSKLATVAGQLIGVIQQGRAASQVDPRQMALPHVANDGAGSQQQEGNDMSIVVRMAVGQLLAHAAANAPYAQVADQAQSLVSDEIILGMLDHEQWFDVMVQAAPEAAAHRNYFEGLRAEILSRYPIDTEGAPNESTPVESSPLPKRAPSKRAP